MKKGLTIIELLAVIVIVVVIVLISTPIFLRIIENSRKKALENTGYGIIESIREFYIDHLSEKGVVGDHSFTFPNQTLKISGAIPNGNAKLYADGTISIAIHDHRFCATKGRNEDIITLTDYVEGKCFLDAPILATDKIKSYIGKSEVVDLEDYGIRYQGKDPKNYVSFNDELWRIIGIVDGKVKIVRNESIGEQSWDSSTSNDVEISGVKDNKGFNNWLEADLMKTLNPNYDQNQTINNYGQTFNANNSIYWNKSTGLCSLGNANDLKNCNYSQNGLKDSAKELIDDAVWYLGGTEFNTYKNDYGFLADIYKNERGTKVFKNRDTSWSGKVGLIYPSDYVLASSSEECRTSSPNKWSSSVNSICLENYLNKGENYWTIQPLYKNHHYVLYIDSSGKLKDNYASFKNIMVYPSVYLKDDVDIESGDGSKQNPFILNKK